jgi:REP element-mobilizing transposase RayT
MGRNDTFQHSNKALGRCVRALWSPIYYAGSCGGAPIAIIRQYIEKQRTPH